MNDATDDAVTTPPRRVPARRPWAGPLLLVPLFLAMGVLALSTRPGCGCIRPSPADIRRWCGENEPRVVAAARERGASLSGYSSADEYWSRYRGACEEAVKRRPSAT
jgi:hypothetical protein